MRRVVIAILHHPTPSRSYGANTVMVVGVIKTAKEFRRRQYRSAKKLRQEGLNVVDFLGLNLHANQSKDEIDARVNATAYYLCR